MKEKTHFSYNIFCIFLLFAHVLTFQLEIKELEFLFSNRRVKMEVREKYFFSTSDGCELPQDVRLHFAPGFGFALDGHFLLNAWNMVS